MAQAPEGPRSKKNRPFGSGTTNATRRQKRQHLQWSNLGQAGPTDPALLLNHLEALEKAQEELQKSLEKLSCQSHRSTLDDLESHPKRFGKGSAPESLEKLSCQQPWVIWKSHLNGLDKLVWKS